MRVHLRRFKTHGNTQKSAYARNRDWRGRGVLNLMIIVYTHYFTLLLKFILLFVITLTMLSGSEHILSDSILLLLYG